MTLAIPLEYLGAGVYDNILYIINGDPDNTKENSAPFDYNLSGNVSWVTQNISDFYFDSYSSPDYIYFFSQSIVQIGEIVYGTFPYTKDLAHRALLKYSLVNHSFTDTNTYQAIRNSSRANGSCATFDSNLKVIYILGYLFTEYYNLSSDAWTYFPDPNQKTKHSGCAMDINSQYIFKFGGRNDTLHFDIIEKYNVSNDSWAILPNVTLIQPMNYLQCLFYENENSKIYCTGGGSDDAVYSVVHGFDPETSTIDYTSYKLNIPRINHRMILFDDCLFVMGGYNGVRLDSIEYLCLNQTSDFPSSVPTFVPSRIPTYSPSVFPSNMPSNYPSLLPTYEPSNTPSVYPSKSPTMSTIAPVVQTNDESVSVTLIVSVVVGACVCFCAIVISFAYAVIWQRRKRETTVLRTAGYVYAVKPVVEIPMESFNIGSSVQLPSIPQLIPDKVGEDTIHGGTFINFSTEHESEGVTDGDTFGN